MLHWFKKRAVQLVPRRILWRFSAQNIEYRFHINNKWRQTEKFMEQTSQLMQTWGFQPMDFAREIIVDLGAGSKLRSKYFQDARIVAIEPLADKFIRDIAWSDLKDAWRVYSQPAEQPVPDIQGQVAFVMCINVLDHVFEYEAVLANVFDMLQPGGVFLLSVDLHDQASLTHPVPMMREPLLAALDRCGFERVREYSDIDLDAARYGEGEAYTLVLRKPV